MGKEQLTASQLLKADYQYIEQMPDCAEKYLTQLYLHFEILRLSDNEEKYLQNLTAVYENLKRRLAIENLNSDVNIQKFLNLGQPNTDQNTDQEVALQVLEEILNAIQPVNITLFLRLLDDTEAAAQKIHSKNVIALLGLTGAGKSTTLHYLAGAKMEVVEQEEGLSYVNAKYPETVNNDLQQVEIGHSLTQSKTRHIQPVEIKHDNNNYIVCDIPGFKDSDGAAREITNGIVLVNALRKTTSVKPVVVINLEDLLASRAAILKELLETLGKFIPDLKNQVQTISYVFTKTKGLTKKGIHNNLNQIYKELKSSSSKTDKNILLLLNHIVESTKNEADVDVLSFATDANTLEQQRVVLLNKFTAAGACRIENPADNFQYFATTASEGKLKLQLEKYQQRIKLSLARGEFALLSYDLAELAKLDEKLNFQYADISTAYAEVRASVSAHIQDVSTRITTSLSAIIDQNFDWQKGASALAAQCRADIKNLIVLDPERENCFSDSMQQDFFEFCADPMIAKQDELLSAMYTQKDMALVAKNIIQIGHISTFAECFDNVNAASPLKDKYSEAARLRFIYREAREFVIEKFEELIKNAENAINNSDFKTYAENMKQASALNTHCENILTDSQSRLDTLRKNGTTKVNTTISAGLNYLRLKNKDNTNSRVVSDAITLLKDIKAAGSEACQQLGIKEKTIQFTIDSLTASSGSYFHDLANEISLILSGHKLAAVQNISVINNNLKIMRQMHNQEPQLMAVYKQLVTKVTNYVDALSKDCEGEIARLRQSKEDKSNYDVYAESLVRLYNAEAILEDNEKLGKFNEARNSAYSFIINSNNEFITLDKISRFTANSCADLLPEMVSYQQKIIITFIIDTRSHLKNALTYVEDRSELVAQSQNIYTALDNLEAYQKTDAITNETYLKESKSRVDACVASLEAFRTKLLELSKKNINDPFIAMPELKKYQAVADILFALDKMMDMSASRYASAITEIQNLYKTCNSKISSIIAGYTTRIEYINADSEITVFVNRGADVSLPNKLTEFHNKIEINLSHFREYPADETLEKLYKLADEVSSTSLKERTDGLKSFIFRELNSLLSQIYKFEYSEGKRLLEKVEALFARLPKDSNELDKISRKIKEISSDLLQTALQEDQTLESLQTDEVSQTLLALSTAYLSFKFAFAKRVKEVVNKQLTARLVEFNGNTSALFYKIDGADELLANFIKIRQLHLDYSETHNQFNQYSQESKQAFFYYKPALDSTLMIDELFEKDVMSFVERWGSSVDLLRDVATINTNSFSHLAAYAKIYNPQDQKIQNIFLKYPQFSASNIQAILSDMINSFEQKQQRLDELLHKKQVTVELVEILDQLKKADAVLINMKQLFQNEPTGRLKNLALYADYKTKVKQHIDDWKRNLEFPLLGRDYLVSASDDSRNGFYEDFFRIFKANQNIGILSAHIDNVCDAIPTDGVAEVQVSLEDINKYIFDLLNLIPSDNAEIYEQLGYWHDNLRACFEHFDHPIIKDRIDHMREDLRSKMREKLQLMVSNAIALNVNDDKNDDASVTIAENLAKHLVELRFILSHPQLALYTFEIKSAITQILNHYAEHEAGLIPALTNNLRAYAFDDDKSMYGKMLILENTALSAHKNFLYNTASKLKVNKQKVTGTIHTDGPYNEEMLQSQYDLFMEEYQALYRAATQPDKNTAEELVKLTERARLIPQDSTRPTYQHKVRSILAHLFAYWTVEDSDGYKKEVAENNLKSPDDRIPQEILEQYLRQPRVTQVLAIFRLLEMDMNEEVLNFLYTGKGSFSYYIGKFYMGAAKTVNDATQAVKDTLNDMATGVKEAFNNAAYAMGAREAVFNLTDKAVEAAALQAQLEAEQIAKDKQIDFEKINNHLAEIPTGEGKSVTLAMLASVFAIMGQKVHCGCYSEYLSERDFEQFKPVFDAFGVTDKILYGRFEELCENLLNQEIDIRKAVLAQFDGQEKYQKPQKELNSTTVQLLIDEIDKLVNDFFGKLYRTQVLLKSQEITDLIMMMWAMRNDPKHTDLDYIKTTAQFKACCEKYKGWDDLMLESVKSMCVALNLMKELENPNFDSKIREQHRYYINPNDGLIGYPKDDGIQYDQTRGFMTVFAYIKEHTDPNKKYPNSEKTLNDVTGIWLKCGEFLYVEMLMQYMHMRGVTATLTGLAPEIRTLLHDKFCFTQETILSSAYPDRDERFQFNPETDVHVVNDEEYYKAIADENEKALYIDGQRKGASLVFFDSDSELEQFYNSAEFANGQSGIIKKKAKTLTSSTEAKTRNVYISGAAAKGQNTLSTDGYARGADFVCHDTKLEKGLGVISTYVPTTRANEIQQKGRTARQGMPGFYRWVIRASELKKVYGFTQVQIDHFKTYEGRKYAYREITAARDKIEKRNLQSGMAIAESKEADHQNSLQFLKDLCDGKTADIRKYITQVNREPNFNKSTKGYTVLLLDGTGSMEEVIKNAKETINTMFVQGRDILEQNGFKKESFALRVLVYRNYNADEIIDFTDIETDPKALEKWLARVRLDGGYGVIYDAESGREAIEAGLQKVNHWITEGKKSNCRSVEQVILIGDAGPNLPVQVDERFNSRICKKHNIIKSYCDQEVDKIKKNGVNVNTYYLDERARVDFEEIAKKTGGKCSWLDVSGQSSSMRLAQEVTRKILNSIGGDVLVAAFDEQYGGYSGQVKKGKGPAPLSAKSSAASSASSSSSSSSSTPMNAAVFSQAPVVGVQDSSGSSSSSSSSIIIEKPSPSTSNNNNNKY